MRRLCKLKSRCWVKLRQHALWPEVSVTGRYRPAERQSTDKPLQPTLNPCSSMTVGCADPATTIALGSTHVMTGKP